MTRPWTIIVAPRHLRLLRMVLVSNLLMVGGIQIARPGLPEPIRRYLDVPFALVGRHQGCNPCLEDSQVRTRHYYLQTIAGRVFALDLSSGSGLGRWLAPSDLLQIGSYSLRLVAAGKPMPEKSEQWNPLDSGTAG